MKTRVVFLLACALVSLLVLTGALFLALYVGESDASTDGKATAVTLVDTASGGWKTFSDPYLGVTLSYPQGYWAYTTTDSVFVSSEAWDCGSCELRPPSTFQFTVSRESALPSSATATASGEPWLSDLIVSAQRYPAITSIDTQHRVISVYYTAQGMNWKITGAFAASVNQDDSLVDLFKLMLARVHHGTVAISLPTPTPRPISADYLNPRLSMIRALQEVGKNPSAPTYGAMLEQAEIFPYMYHLASANVKEFNNDTAGYYSWLVSWLSDYLHGNQDWREHCLEQIDAVFHYPDSQAAEAMRQLAAASSDYSVYWNFVIYPAVFDGITKPGIMKSDFEQIEAAYISYAESRGPSAMPFDEYFAQTGYLTRFGMVPGNR
jgi:hypothetical protein